MTQDAAAQEDIRAETPLQTLTPQPAQTDKPTRVRLHFLDGLRGIAALYVVLYHLGMSVLRTLQTFYPTCPPRLLRFVTLVHVSLLNHGHYAVVVFIVLSGFCLTLPLLRSDMPDLHLPTFFWRRARRLLPPYYASVVFALALIALVPGMNTLSGAAWDDALPALTPAAIGTHVLLVHNLFAPTVAKINPALWSVALEWQIYFAFALLLIPVWRKWGVGAALLASFVAGLAPHFLTPTTSPVRWSSSWMLSAFGLGMAGAWVCFGHDKATSFWRVGIPWAWLTWGTGIGIIGLLSVQRERYESHPLLGYLQIAPHNGMYAADIVVAVWAAVLIVFCTLWLQSNTGQSKGRVPFALRLCDSSLAVRLGTFSYSLYLIHTPVLAITVLVCRAWISRPLAAVAFVSVGGLLASLLWGYFFFLLIERRFLNVPSKPMPAPHAILS